MININYNFTKERLSAVEMQKIWEDVRKITDYNRNYFFEEFGFQMIDELRLDLLNLWGKIG